jgi:TIR domain
MVGTAEAFASERNRGVFISYRREGAAAYARLLYERLSRRFPGSIFLDLNDIHPGDDFVRLIVDKVSSCDVLVALIDRDWITRRDLRGARRLDDPNDFVRLEIATALEREVRVIPALLNGAPMPGAAELPECLRNLARLSAINITDTDLDHHAGLLIRAVERELSLKYGPLPAGDHQGKRHPADSGDPSQSSHRRSPSNLASFFQNPSKRNQLVLAALACALCVIAQLIGSMQVVTHFFIHRFGFQTARLTAYAVLLLTVAAYGFGVTSFYRARTNIRKYWLIAILVAIFAAAVGFNLRATPWPKLSDLARQELTAWSSRVFENQNPDGGIRTDIRSPGASVFVWDMAQSLKSVLLNRQVTAQHNGEIRRAFQYIEAARRNSPEPGWGVRPNSSRTLTEISSWITLAYLESLQAEIWTQPEQLRVLASVERELRLLAARQDPSSGGWGPISDQKPAFTRTYPTMIALWAFLEAGKVAAIRQRLGSDYSHVVDNAIQWLLGNCDPARGWVPNPNRKGQTSTYPGLTAQTLFVLSRAQSDQPSLASANILHDLKTALLSQGDLVRLPIDSDTAIPSNDQFFDTPDAFSSEGMQFLWFPWGVAMYAVLSGDRTLSDVDRGQAADNLKDLLSNLDQDSHRLEQGPTFILAENIIGISQAFQNPALRKP